MTQDDFGDLAAFCKKVSAAPEKFAAEVNHGTYVRNKCGEELDSLSKDNHAPQGGDEELDVEEQKPSVLMQLEYFKSQRHSLLQGSSVGMAHGFSILAALAIFAFMFYSICTVFVFIAVSIIGWRMLTVLGVMGAVACIVVVVRIIGLTPFNRARPTIRVRVPTHPKGFWGFEYCGKMPKTGDFDPFFFSLMMAMSGLIVPMETYISTVMEKEGNHEALVKQEMNHSVMHMLINRSLAEISSFPILLSQAAWKALFFDLAPQFLSSGLAGSMEAGMYFLGTVFVRLPRSLVFEFWPMKYTMVYHLIEELEHTVTSVEESRCLGPFSFFKRLIVSSVFSFFIMPAAYLLAVSLGLVHFRGTSDPARLIRYLVGGALLCAGMAVTSFIWYANPIDVGPGEAQHNHNVELFDEWYEEEGCPAKFKVIHTHDCDEARRSRPMAFRTMLHSWYQGCIDIVASVFRCVTRTSLPEMAPSDVKFGDNKRGEYRRVVESFVQQGFNRQEISDFMSPLVLSCSEISYEELAMHSTEEDCWVCIDGNVLDVTDWLKVHPGGKQAIMQFAGGDATQAFYDHGHSSIARNRLNSLYIGRLETHGTSSTRCDDETVVESVHSV